VLPHEPGLSLYTLQHSTAEALNSYTPSAKDTVCHPKECVRESTRICNNFLVPDSRSLCALEGPVWVIFDCTTVLYTNTVLYWHPEVRPQGRDNSGHQSEVGCQLRQKHENKGSRFQLMDFRAVHTSGYCSESSHDQLTGCFNVDIVWSERTQR
jgi:hypothetical protein